MDYLANLSVWTTGVVAFVTLICAICRRGARMFEREKWRDVMDYNPPGALMFLYGWATPILLRILGVLVVVTPVTVLLAVLT